MKDFDGWNQVKKKIDDKKKPPLFKEREIWWCHAGVNVGFEVFGKGNGFNRPVLILKKYSANTFLGLPLTSSRKENKKVYFPIDFNEKQGSILISQAKTFSSKRLTYRMGVLPHKVFSEIVTAFKDSFEN